jgi:hypothetical protein
MLAEKFIRILETLLESSPIPRGDSACKTDPDVESSYQLRNEKGRLSLRPLSLPYCLWRRN